MHEETFHTGIDQDVPQFRVSKSTIYANAYGANLHTSKEMHVHFNTFRRHNPDGVADRNPLRQESGTEPIGIRMHFTPARRPMATDISDFIWIV